MKPSLDARSPGVYLVRLPTAWGAHSLGDPRLREQVRQVCAEKARDRVELLQLAIEPDGLRIVVRAGRAPEPSLARFVGHVRSKLRRETGYDLLQCMYWVEPLGSEREVIMAAAGTAAAASVDALESVMLAGGRTRRQRATVPRQLWWWEKWGSWLRAHAPRPRWRAAWAVR